MKTKWKWMPHVRIWRVQYGTHFYGVAPMEVNQFLWDVQNMHLLPLATERIQ